MSPSSLQASHDTLTATREAGDGFLHRGSFIDSSIEMTFADRSRRLRELAGRVNEANEFRMPGEFEYQSGMMISCQAICSSQAIRDVVQAVSRRIGVVGIYSNDEDYEAAREVLVASGISEKMICFAQIPHDTMWARDYGPVVLASKRNRDLAVLDTQYQAEGRDQDEVVPVFVAESAALPIVDAELKIEGGNVISNGQGLVITSTKLFDENPEIDSQTVTDALCMYYGATQVVYLEPLANESTGHVDMFATFTSPNCVVVGQYDASVDRENAAILERNANTLASVRLPQRRLHVRRIPMPSNDDGVYRTYTNVVYANDVLFMPVYSGTNIALQHKAIATYQALLPGMKVTTINADDLIVCGGALHCAIMNLGPLSADRIGGGRGRPHPRHMAMRR